MRAVAVHRRFPGTVHEAESCWYDTARWPSWVEGLARVVQVTGDWPQVGSSILWESGPAGRGRVTERVIAYEPLVGQTNEVRDDSIEGRQSVSFIPVDGEVEVALSLEYQLRRRTPFTPIVDVLFIRRAMTASLGTTVGRFGAELQAARRPDVG